MMVFNLCVLAMSSLTVDAPKLSAESLYNGINRPIMLEIEAGDSSDAGDLSIVLMTAAGDVMAGPVATREGRFDLAAEWPQIWELRRACYLQLLRNGEPVGSGLVLQPLMNRPPIWIKRDTRPDGKTRYTRIVGWGNDEPEGWGPPMTAEEQQAIERATGGEVDGDQEGEPAPPAEAVDDARPEPEIEMSSVLRIYPEEDVIIETTEGDIRIALRPDEAPNTVWNFLDLSRGGFYRDVVFHRIVPLERNGWPFVIQAGDPTASGSGGPGYWLPIESSQLPHDFGVISMARADDPDSAGSQFFICLSREGTARLDGQYCAFGYAVEGADAIQKIASVEIADLATGRPADPPVIRDVRLIPAPPRSPDVGRPDQRVQIAAPETPSNPGRVPR